MCEEAVVSRGGALDIRSSDGEKEVSVAYRRHRLSRAFVRRVEEGDSS